MKCPYCCEEIDNSALVCSHCTRDLYLFKPILEKISNMECELEKALKKIEKLELSGKNLDSISLADSSKVSSERIGTHDLRNEIFLWLTPLILIIISHYTITMVFDASLLWLRIVSILIPLPFGYLLLANRSRNLLLALFQAFLVASIAVVSMSGVVHMVDGTTILPQDILGWREFIEYAASITLSFATGMVLGRMAWRQQENARMDGFLAGIILSHLSNTSETINVIHKTTTTIIATTSAVVSAYTGLRAFL